MLHGDTKTESKNNHDKNEAGANIKFSHVDNPRGPIPTYPANLAVKGLGKGKEGGALYEY